MPDTLLPKGATQTLTESNLERAEPAPSGSGGSVEKPALPRVTQELRVRLESGLRKMTDALKALTSDDEVSDEQMETSVSKPSLTTAKERKVGIKSARPDTDGDTSGSDWWGSVSGDERQFTRTLRESFLKIKTAPAVKSTGKKAMKREARLKKTKKAEREVAAPTPETEKPEKVQVETKVEVAARSGAPVSAPAPPCVVKPKLVNAKSEPKKGNNNKKVSPPIGQGKAGLEVVSVVRPVATSTTTEGVKAAPAAKTSPAKTGSTSAVSKGKTPSGRASVRKGASAPEPKPGPSRESTYGEPMKGVVALTRSVETQTDIAVDPVAVLLKGLAEFTEIVHHMHDNKQCGLAKRDRLLESLNEMRAAVVELRVAAQVAAKARPASYAEKAGVAPSAKPKKLLPPQIQKPSRHPAEERVAFICLKAEGATCTSTRTALTAALDPVRAGIRVKAVHPIEDGSGRLLIKLAGEQDLKRLMESPKLKAFTVKSAERRRPQIRLDGVARSLKDDDVVESIIDRHLKGVVPEGELRGAIKVSRRYQQRGRDFDNLILEVTPQVRAVLLSQVRVYLGWSSVRVTDFQSVRHCYNCHSYRHIASMCKSPMTCSHCAESGHKKRHVRVSKSLQCAGLAKAPIRPSTLTK